MKFNLITPHKIIFGQNSLSQLTEEITIFGQKAFIVTGTSAIKRSGILSQVSDKLKDCGIEAVLFSDVKPEPSVDMAEKARDVFKKNKCDFVIGLGGGSVLDVAKSAAALANESGKMIEYQSGREIKIPGVPFIAIPTTSGTGSEATYNSVLTDTLKKAKRSIRAPEMMAKLVIIDPALTISVPPNITAYTGIDTLCHLIEAYVSIESNPITDALCIQGIESVNQGLHGAFINGSDIEAREQMALASLLGGMVLANAGLGAVHGLAASIGGLYEIPHGLVCGVLLSHVMRYNVDVVKEKFACIARIFNPSLNEESADTAAMQAADLVDNLLKEINIPTCPCDAGIYRDNIPAIVAGVSSSVKYNPKKARAEELTKILEDAMTV
ncbi:MAG: iron-containing alcohol dehydrogenase [bacterium]|nr:iron-containing alcohol dehydrogenase [bacterium]